MTKTREEKFKISTTLFSGTTVYITAVTTKCRTAFCLKRATKKSNTTTPRSTTWNAECLEFSQLNYVSAELSEALDCSVLFMHCLPLVQ